MNLTTQGIDLRHGKYWIAIRSNKARIAKLNLSVGVKPRLPNYVFNGPYATSAQAEKYIPHGVELIK